MLGLAYSFYIANTDLGLMLLNRLHTDISGTSINLYDSCCNLHVRYGTRAHYIVCHKESVPSDVAFVPCALPLWVGAKKRGSL